MERLFVLVLTLVTVVTGTPHGYGVKGGASAKAEASAGAGGFGDLGPVPLSIPSGSGYSGSFSKSSSSSFASSSASSSSSSYSFNGSGANGIAGIGIDKGCSTGTCPGADASGPSLNGAQPLTGANAVSAAHAKALSGSYTPCQGSNCGSPGEKCSSGQCPSLSEQKNQNGCAANGNCQSPSSETELAHEGSSDKNDKGKQEGSLSDGNDFAVNINRNSQSKLSHDSNGQYYNNEKSYNPESGCSNGKCSPSNPNQASLGSNQSKPPVPSSYLTTPNENPPCTTPNCNYPSENSGTQTGGLPSSYNVPIQSATNPPNTYYSSAPPGYSSNPDNSVGSYNVPNYHSGQQGSSSHGPCTSGQCDVPSYSNGKTNSDAVFGAKTPNYAHGISVPSNVQPGHSGQPGCTTPYCSGLPTYSSLPTNQPNSGCTGAACSSSPLPGSPVKPFDSNAPAYTGGFGGPAGFLQVPSGSNKLPGNPGYDSGHNTPGAGTPTGPFVSTPGQGSFGANNPNKLNSNNNYGSTQTSSNGGSIAFEYNKPSTQPSTASAQFNPSATGSYGAPTATSAVPQGSIPHSVNNGVYKPTPSHTASSPNYSGSNYGSIGSSLTSSESNGIHGSFGVTKPNTPSNPVNSPAYTGGFGGPSEPVGGSGVSFGAGGSFNKPGSGNCGSVNCNTQTDINVNGGSTSYDKTSSSTSTSNQNKPAYTGGFGGPTGLLNPNNVHVPSNTPTVSSGNSPCAYGNCGSKSTPSTSQGSSTTSAHSVASAAASANAEVYSGGFGGPPGFLKPYDDGKVNIPIHGNLANGHSPSSNNGDKDTTIVNGKNSVPGSSANGANAAAQASATASATAGSYGENNNNQNNNGASRGCNSGCNPSGTGDGVGAGSVASAKSIAGANAYGIGGNFASSSASAHASAGAATKGGYGRK